MKSYTMFKEYIWLVNTIYHAGSISLEEINRRWKETEMSGGLPLARSTFNRHKDAIEEMFGIYIDCDRKQGFKYSIGNSEVLEEDSVQNWILSTLSVNNMISESKSLHERILLEPVSADHPLQEIIDAMRRNLKITITYQKYTSTESKSYTFAPYCLKLFHRRWYVLGFFGGDKYRIFSLDRIRSTESGPEKFELDEAFDAEAFFSECFGIVQGDGTPCERVVLRAYGIERYFMRDLPLHKSQKKVAEGENYIDYELHLRPTLEFLGYIVSRSNLARVMEPQWVADEVCKMHEDSIKRYAKE